MSVKVTEVGFTTRVLNILKEAEIETMEQLSTWTEPELRKFRNCGNNSIGKIKEALAKHGLSLADERHKPNFVPQYIDELQRKMATLGFRVGEHTASLQRQDLNFTGFIKHHNELAAAVRKLEDDAGMFMGLRDRFAIAALNGLLSNPEMKSEIIKHGGAGSGWIEETAYDFADAMLKRREHK